MSGKKNQQAAQEPASGSTEPASAVPADASNVQAGGESAGDTETPAPKKVQALASNGGGGRRVLATAHINRAGGNLKPGDSFELADAKEAARLAGCFKEEN